jgi:carbon-monoxide dehydrogenase medium subunit
MVIEIPLVNITARNTHIIPFEFEYYEPRSLEEALELLAKFKGEAKILAGGTDLLVKMKTRIIEPKVIVNIKRIQGLRYIIEENEHIRIGALTTLRDIEKSTIVEKNLPALHDAVKVMGSIQIRNMATLVGNLCNASPAADTAPPLLVYNARVVAMSTRGKRFIPLEEFFKGPGITALEPDEMLVEVIVKKNNKGSSAFEKVSRVAVDLAIASAAVYAEISSDGVIEDSRVAVGSVAPKPIRTRILEERIKGLRLGSEELKKAIYEIDREISPITDVRSTAEYRRHIVKVLVWNAIERVYRRIRGECV